MVVNSISSYQNWQILEDVFIYFDKTKQNKSIPILYICIFVCANEDISSKLDYSMMFSNFALGLFS